MLLFSHVSISSFFYGFAWLLLPFLCYLRLESALKQLGLVLELLHVASFLLQLQIPLFKCRFHLYQPTFHLLGDIKDVWLMCGLEFLLQPFQLGFPVHHELGLPLQEASQSLLGCWLYVCLLLSVFLGLCVQMLLLLLWVIRKGLKLLQLLAEGLQLGLDALQLCVLPFFRDGRECHVLILSTHHLLLLLCYHVRIVLYLRHKLGKWLAQALEGVDAGVELGGLHAWLEPVDLGHEGALPQLTYL